MTRKSSSRLSRDSQKNETSAIEKHLINQMTEALEEARQLNSQVLQQFMDSATAFFDALRAVDTRVAQLEALFNANGGEDTARIMGKASDQLLGGLNNFERVVQIVASNPFSDIQYDKISELVKYCNACRIVANEYITAEPSARPAIKKRAEKAIAGSQGMANELFQNPRHPTVELRFVADMLIDRLDNPNGSRPTKMGYGEALSDLLQTEPAIYNRFFTHITKEQKMAYARQLVKRRRGGVL